MPNRGGTDEEPGRHQCEGGGWNRGAQNEMGVEPARNGRTQNGTGTQSRGLRDKGNFVLLFCFTPGLGKLLKAVYLLMSVVMSKKRLVHAAP